MTLSAPTSPSRNKIGTEWVLLKDGPNANVPTDSDSSNSTTTTERVDHQDVKTTPVGAATLDHTAAPTKEESNVASVKGI